MIRWSFSFASRAAAAVTRSYQRVSAQELSVFEGSLVEGPKINRVKKERCPFLGFKGLTREPKSL